MKALNVFHLVFANDTDAYKNSQHGCRCAYEVRLFNVLLAWGSASLP
jgi:hypothetical protein